MKTLGHLSSNGGLRGHSVGSIFPWRILIQGTMDNLKYWVINPQGEKVGKAWQTCDGAYVAAELRMLGWLGGAS